MKKIATYDPISKCAYYTFDSIDLHSLNDTVEKMNERILNDFYAAVKWVLHHYDECIELQSNTINPAQQHVFTPLRIYRVLKNGHYREVRIYQKCFGGILIEEQ